MQLIDCACMSLLTILYCSKCGIDNPTWAEIHHFIKFLDIQLESSEKSVFCNQAFVRDVLSGMKGFVVKFMIRMSQVLACFCCTCYIVRSVSIFLGFLHSIT